MMFSSKRAAIVACALILSSVFWYASNSSAKGLPRLQSHPASAELAQLAERPIQFDNLSSIPKSMLKILKRVESSRQLTDGDLTEFNQDGDTLAGNAFDASRISAAKVKVAIDLKSRNVNERVNELEKVEESLSSLNIEVQQLLALSNEVQRKVQAGTILLSEGLIAQATDQDLRNMLSDAALRLYVEKRLLNAERANKITAQLMSQMTLAPETEPKSSMRLLDILVPSANAAVAIPCIPACASKNWVACAICIGNGLSVGGPIFDDFTKCWNSTDEAWSGWVKRGFCLAILIAKLA
jgi:hypothetical protein